MKDYPWIFLFSLDLMTDAVLSYVQKGLTLPQIPMVILAGILFVTACYKWADDVDEAEDFDYDEYIEELKEGES